jgi:hypothetical protein
VAIALVSGASAAAGSAPGIDTATTSAVNTTGANLIVIQASNYAVQAAPTITDNKSNTWTALTAQAGSVVRGTLYYCLNPTVGSGHTFTITSTGGYPSLSILAFSGVATTSAFDVQNGSTASSSTTVAPGSITPSAANELVITGVGTQSAAVSSVGSGFTIGSTANWSASQFGSSLAYLIQTTATAENPTWTMSGSATLSAEIASFKAAAGGGSIKTQSGTARLTKAVTKTQTGVANLIAPSNTPPTVALNAPADTGSVSTTTPQLTFTGTDAQSNAISYEVQVDTVNTFDSQTASIIDSYSESNQSTGYQLETASADYAAAGQTFTGNGSVLGSAKFYLKKTGAPTGTVYATLYNITGISGSTGKPTGAVLDTSATINVSTLTTSYALYSFLFSGGITPTNGTVYAIALNYGSGDLSNYVQVGIDATSPTHIGNAFVNTGSLASPVWASSGSGQDTCFYVYSTGSPLLDKLSNTDTGFVDITNGAHTDPFTSGEQIGYTTPALTNGSTYYWRVRGKDPTGSNTFGAWATTRSFTVSSGTVLSTTQTGVARLSKVFTKTNTGTARLAQVFSKTNSGTSRLAKVITATQTSVARIQVNKTKTQSAVGRVANNLTKTQSAVARTAITGSKTQSATARIQRNLTKTQSAVARIQKSLTATQSAISRIANSLTHTQTGKSRIANSPTKTQPGLGRIAQNFTYSLSAVANIIQSSSKTKTQSAVAHIQATVTKTQPATGRIQQLLAVTHASVARISNTFTKTQSGVARIQSTVTKTQLSTARLQRVLNYTQAAKAAIASVVNKTQPSAARISQTISKPTTGISRISNTFAKTQSSIARVSVIPSKTQTATARITGGALSKTQSGKARIAVSVSKTQGAVARLAVNVSKTITALSHISNSFTRTQSSIARIGSTFTHQQTATAHVVSVQAPVSNVTVKAPSPINLTASGKVNAITVESPSIVNAVVKQQTTAPLVIVTQPPVSILVEAPRDVSM